MKSAGLRARRTLAVLCAVVLVVTSCGGCFGIHRVWQEAITIESAGTVHDKIAFARSFVTQTRYDRLRHAVRERFPGLSEEDSRRIFLRWQVIKSPRTEAVVVIVGIVDAGRSLDPQAIVGYCRRQIESELATEGAKPDTRRLTTATTGL
jgi:hypothetical protein